MNSMKLLANAVMEHWDDPLYRLVLADYLEDVGLREQGMILRQTGYWTRKLISMYTSPCYLLWSTNIGRLIIGTTNYTYCEASFNCPFYGMLYTERWWCRRCSAHSGLSKYVDEQMEIQTLPTE